MGMNTLIRHTTLVVSPRLRTATITAHARQTAQLIRETLIGAPVTPMVERHAPANRVAGVGTVAVQGRRGGHRAREKMAYVVVVDGDVDCGGGFSRGDGFVEGRWGWWGCVLEVL